MPLSYVLVKNLIGPPGTPGAAGRTIYNSSGPPTASTGTLGDFYLDTSAYVLYGPKTSATAWPTAGQSLVGPPGPSTPQTIPSDLRLNSLTLAPVSGATAPEQIQVLDSSGNVKFLADAAGNITAAATALAASAQLTQFTSTNSQGQTNAVLRFPGVFGTGANANYPLSGISSDSRGNLVFSYLGVPFLQTQNTGYQSNGAQAPAGYAFNTAFTSGSYSFSGGGSTLIQASASGIVLGPTTSTYSIPTTINTYAGTILQLQKSNSTVASFDTTGSGTLSGNLSVAGTITAGSIANSGQNSAASHQATGNGTVGAPSYSFTNQADTGVYLPTQSTSAAVMGLSVNGTQALALSKSGASVPGTLGVQGATTLAATTTGALSSTSVTASGTATAAALTISAANGPLTFGDGSIQTTAYTGQATGGTGSSTSATGSGYAEGYVGQWGVNRAMTANASQYAYSTTQSLAQYIFAPRNAVQLVGVTYFAYGTAATNVTINISYYGSTIGTSTSLTTFASAPVSTAGNSVTQTLATPITLTAGNCYYVNVTSSASTTVNLEGYLVLGTPLSLAASSQAPSFTTTALGSVSAPALVNNSLTSTGAYWAGTTSAPTFNIAAGGVNALSASSTGVSAPLTVTSTTPAGTPSFVSSQGFKQTIDMCTYATGTGAMPTSYTQFMRPTFAATGGAGFMNAFVVMPYAGSVLSIAGTSSATLASGQTATMQVYIRGAASGLLTTVSSTQGSNVTTANKGQYSFTAGAGIAVFILGSTSAISSSFTASITVEMAG